MRTPLLVEYCESLASRRRVTAKAIARFVEQVRSKYTEATLLRLLWMQSEQVRHAALLALRFIGTMTATPALVARLGSEDPETRTLAEAALWSIWFRADSEEAAEELHRLTDLMERREYPRALAGLNRLIRRRPHFAEAYNQRAILYWRQREYESSLADCERALELNPLHFGAQAGKGECLLGLERPAEALEAFRKALLLNPYLEGVQENIQTLEELLREDQR